VRDQRPDTMTSTALLPSIKGQGADRPVRATHAQAGVITQDRLCAPAAFARVNNQGCQPLRKRTAAFSRTATISGRDELTETNTGVEAFGGEVYELRARGDLHFDLGIGLVERHDHSLKDQRNNCPGNCEAQEPGGRCPKSRAASLAATSSSKAGFARERKRSPASVRPTLRVSE